MKKSIIVCLSLLLGITPLKAEDFFFFSTTDNLFENPENWFPSYPGTHIKAEDKVIILGEAYITGYDLLVEGLLEVKFDAKLISVGNDLKISGGKIHNAGTLIFNHIDNQGELTNSVAADLSVHRFHNLPGSLTYNSHSAQFNISGNLVNEGRFDNYSHCFISGKFANLNVFNQVHHSELNVAGEFMMAPGSTIYRSKNSKVYLGNSNLSASAQ